MSSTKIELKKLQELIQSKPDLLRKQKTDKEEEESNSDDDSCSDEDEHFVSSTQIELEKTEESLISHSIILISHLL